MALRSWSASRLLRAAGALFFAGLAPWSLGCGGGGEQPVTAQTSKFQVAGEGEGDAKADPARPAADRSPTEPSGDADNGAADHRSNLAKPPSRPPVGEAEGAPGRGRGPARRVTPETVPDGSPEELAALLAEVEQDGPRGKTNREILDSLQQWLKTRLAIVDKILAAEGEDDGLEKLRTRAATSKREILVQMIQAGLPGVDKEMTSFCDAMKVDRSPALVRLGRLTDLQLNLAMIMSGAKEETEGFERALNVALDIEPADEEVFQAVVAAAVTMQQAGKNDVALAAYKKIETKFGESDNEKIKPILSQVLELAKFIEVKFDTLFKNVVTKEPDADAQLLEAVDKLLDGSPGPAIFERLSQAAQELEASRNVQVAGRMYDALGKAFKDHPDAEIAKAAETQVANGKRRADLIGQPFVVEGKKVDGEDFDWKQYEGKIVLVDFWATWCEPCRREMPNLKRTLQKFRDQGFEIVGVNLDKDAADVAQFFSVQTLPWTNVVQAEDLANRCGVEAIPFVVLIGRDGRVIDLHVRGEMLARRLEEIFEAEEKGGNAPTTKPGEEKPAGEKPATEKPATEKPTEEKPAAEKPTEEKPAAEKPAAEKPAEPKPESKQSSRPVPTARQGSGFVAADDAPAPAPRNSTGARRAAPGAAAGVKDKTADAADAPKSDEPEVNPYLARANLKTAELIDYVLNLQEKPKSIQSRPGFSDAIVDACDRVLAAPDASDKFRGIAASAKIETLHKKASTGDKAADEALAKFVDALQEKPIPAVAESVKFLLLERTIVKSNDVPVEKLNELLDQVKKYCTDEKLDGRHLRLASSTVEAINRIEDGDAREKQFSEFGKLFAKSSDKELARYGKKLAKAPAGKESDLVGKPLELAGTTASGAPFDWAKYRGKVVVVDFWATWCGPCVRELPNVKATYEKYKDKGFDILGISLDQDQDALAEFLDKNQIPWQTLAGDGTQEIAQKYGVRGIPTVMLVDRTGKVLAVGHRIDAMIPEIEKQLEAK